MADEFISWKWYVDQDDSSIIIIDVKYYCKVGKLSGIVSKKFPIPRNVFEELRK